MLDDTMKTQLKGYLERVVRPIEIAAHVDDSENAREMMALLNDIVPLSDQITLTEHRAADNERAPSFSLSSPGQDIHVTFAGLPMGHEFT